MQEIQVSYNKSTQMATAFCEVGEIEVKLDFQRDSILAAKALQKKLGWDYNLTQGCLPNGDFVFVQTTQKITSYQIFTKEKYSYERPFALVLIYDDQANVVQVIQYRCLTDLHASIQRLYPSIKAVYGDIVTLSSIAYDNLVMQFKNINILVKDE